MKPQPSGAEIYLDHLLAGGPGCGRAYVLRQWKAKKPVAHIYADLLQRFGWSPSVPTIYNWINAQQKGEGR